MRYASVTGKGGKKINEDSIGNLKKGNIYCFAVADGLGGYGNGDVASGIAVDAVLRSFANKPEVSRDTLYNYMFYAQQSISAVRENDLNLQKIGTTLAVLVTDGKKAVWGHCGDSRIYRLKGKLIDEVTDDHSLAFSRFKRGEVLFAQIRVLPEKGTLLSSLGDDDYFKPDIYSCDKLKRKSKFLLCSDGFWELVTEEFMESSLKISASPRDWLTQMTEERRCNATENADNFSAIAVFI